MALSTFIWKVWNIIWNRLSSLLLLHLLRRLYEQGLPFLQFWHESERGKQTVPSREISVLFLSTSSLDISIFHHTKSCRWFQFWRKWYSVFPLLPPCRSLSLVARIAVFRLHWGRFPQWDSSFYTVLAVVDQSGVSFIAEVCSILHVPDMKADIQRVL